jgi:hypothetical protein
MEVDDPSVIPKNTMKNIINFIQNISDSQAILALTILTLVIILFGIIYYFYFTGTIFTNGLRQRQCKYMENNYGLVNSKLTSIDPKLTQYQYKLKDYYIKSAYNACSGGSYKNDYVDICVLKNLLKQGVRGLDFEIFSIDDKPVVATSTTESNYVKETFNFVSFSSIMNIIRDYAFAGSTSPNPSDPIILHLRIKSNNQKMFKNFAKLLENYNSILLGKKYSYENHGENLGNIPLSEFMEKVIIVVDKSNNTFLEVQEFYEYVNMTSNSIFMRALHYNEIAYNPDINELIDFNKYGMTIGMPDKGSNPSNPNTTVMRDAGCQLLAMRYQYIDSNLEENNKFFDENGRAFVLKPDKLRQTI